MKFKVAILPGDGIGPEVMDAAVAIMETLAQEYQVALEVSSHLVGGASIDEYDSPLIDDTLQACYDSDAVLLGSIGGPRWEGLPHDKKPERALLGLREALGLYSNLRPAKVYPAMVEASSLKPEFVRDTDLVVVRELTGGIYFGEPRGYDAQQGWNTLIYNREEVERIARVAFDLAGRRRGQVTSVDKANVLESSQFWREVVHEVQGDYPDVTLKDLYVDNATMQLVRQPSQFDVILTQNMFGDILSDAAAMVTGSLGMLPSASLGEHYALYEPVHGSAPDIAGQNMANPLAMIASVGMMFGTTCNLPQAEQILDKAIEITLADGFRTADIVAEQGEPVSTTEMRDRIAESLRRLMEEKRITASPA
ncbi:MAG: 3-isopropylmalate dehydrogenase [Fidelibacterota bacterium]|nr:MAG: 3-isopropylmalate dehydrogenase [Candidatus Neomarinimicrobiota bacterium]